MAETYTRRITCARSGFLISPLAAETRRILVTGGAGYIGSHTAKTLTQAGYDAIVIDNLSAGHRQAVRGAEFVEGDVANVALVRHVLRDHKIFAVMHFAALLDVGASVRDPVGYYRNNVSGTLGLLEAMAAEAVRLFVFSSTCATYG